MKATLIGLVIVTLAQLIFGGSFVTVPQPASVYTVIGEVHCGPTWCETNYGWANYWIETPGCKHPRLFLVGDTFPQDCSLDGTIQTMTGELERGLSGCDIIHVKAMSKCYPTPGGLTSTGCNPNP